MTLIRLLFEGVKVTSELRKGSRVIRARGGRGRVGGPNGQCQRDSRLRVACIYIYTYSIYTACIYNTRFGRLGRLWLELGEGRCAWSIYIYIYIRFGRFRGSFLEILAVQNSPPLGGLWGAPGVLWGEAYGWSWGPKLYILNYS